MPSCISAFHKRIWPIDENGKPETFSIYLTKNRRDCNKMQNRAGFSDIQETVIQTGRPVPSGAVRR